MVGIRVVDTTVESPTNSGVVHSDDDNNPVITNDSDPIMGEKADFHSAENIARSTFSAYFLLNRSN